MKKEKKTFKKLIALFIFVFLFSGIIVGIKIKAAFNDIDGIGYSSLSKNISDTLNKKDEWNLIVVNTDTPLPENFKVSLINFDGTNQVDERINESLKKMLSDAETNGLNMKINSAYRSRQEQESILDEKVNFFISNGYSEEDAKTNALKTVANPGTSEHETGLAVDIGNCDGTDWSDTYDWLSSNAYKYGFIMRYPKGKEDITGISYEIWHYRYVGEKAAKEIHDSGLCLEEYVSEKNK